VRFVIGPGVSRGLAVRMIVAGPAARRARRRRHLPEMTVSMQCPSPRAQRIA
jgi:hypothetical protein